LATATRKGEREGTKTGKRKGTLKERKEGRKEVKICWKEERKESYDLLRSSLVAFAGAKTSFWTRLYPCTKTGSMKGGCKKLDRTMTGTKTSRRLRVKDEDSGPRKKGESGSKKQVPA
jgi:hypothetical protein